MVQVLRSTRVRGDVTRAQILAAALELFAVHGFECTTVKAIAQRCDISDAALYYHFPSKRDIVEALWTEHLQVTPPAPLPETPTREDLKRQLEEGFAFWVENDILSRVIWRLALENEAGALAFREQSLAANRERTRVAMVRMYGERGEVMTEALVAMLSGLAMDAMLQYGNDFPEVVRQPAFTRRVSELIDLLLPDEADPAGYNTVR